MIQPSCQVCLIHDDDSFRAELVKALDASHFSVTVSTDGADAIANLKDRSFRVILLGVNLGNGSGTKALEYLRDKHEEIACGLIILGNADPTLPTLAPFADETLRKPVDPAYVATRARAYCEC